MFVIIYNSSSMLVVISFMNLTKRKRKKNFVEVVPLARHDFLLFLLWPFLNELSLLF